MKKKVEEIIDVAVMVFPDATTYWIEVSDNLKQDIEDKLKNFVINNPEYENSGCSSGMIQIKMPKSSYMSLRNIIGK